MADEAKQGPSCDCGECCCGGSGRRTWKDAVKGVVFLALLAGAIVILARGM